MNYNPVIEEGTVKKIHRKEILKRALYYFIEEKGVLYEGRYYRGKIVDIDANGNIKIDLGIGDQQYMNKVKAIADNRIFIFALEFAQEWKKLYDDANYIAEIDATEFLEKIKAKA